MSHSLYSALIFKKTWNLDLKPSHKIWRHWAITTVWIVFLMLGWWLVSSNYLTSQGFDINSCQNNYQRVDLVLARGFIRIIINSIFFWVMSERMGNVWMCGLFTKVIQNHHWNFKCIQFILSKSIFFGY